MRLIRRFPQLAGLALALAVGSAATIAWAQAANPVIRFTDAATQTAEYIGYTRTLELTSAQRALRDRALSKLAAPCCMKFSMDTCCCACNLAKSVWGLSNFLIVRQLAGAKEIQDNARAWIAFVNPNGFTGDVCDTPGGCPRPFSADGCGGMNERDLSAAR
jgi:hypothetical protein